MTTVRTATDGFASSLRRAVERGFARMEIPYLLMSGALDRVLLARYAARYYAELRIFLDLKLPERMRLCPYGATAAKQLFSRAYVEEQGRFEPGADHACLFRRLCDTLEVPSSVLDQETERYARRYVYMRELEPSPQAMVRELAITYAWESAAPALGGAVAAALRRHYGVPVRALEFFGLHETIDREHSAEALQALLAYARGPELERTALTSVDEALDLPRMLQTP